MYPAAPAVARSLELEDEIVALHERMTKAHSRLLQLIAAYDADESWRVDGAHSMEHWLRVRLGISHAAARDWVEAARKLVDLPAIRSRFAGADLNWDQVRPLVRFATPEEDLKLAQEAGAWTPAALEDEARRRKRIEREEAAITYKDRAINKRWKRDRSTMHIWGDLPYDLAAKVEKTLERMADEAFRRGVDAPVKARYADALVELCSARLAADRDVDRATIVVHATVSDLQGPDGSAELVNGVLLPSETLRRLACDGRLQLVAESADGRTIGVGRTVRIVPRWLGTLVRRRDGGCCRWPACERDGWVDIHHLKPWVDGGRTDLDNLALLCGHHHALVHEVGFRIYGDPNEELRFFRPDYIPIGTSHPMSRRL